MRERSSSSIKRRRLPTRPRDVSGLWPLAVAPANEDVDELLEVDADAIVEVERTSPRFEHTQRVVARSLFPSAESVDDASITAPNGLVRERTLLFRNPLVHTTPRERTQLFRAPPVEASSASEGADRTAVLELPEIVRDLTTEVVRRRRSPRQSDRTLRTATPRPPIPWSLIALIGAALFLVAAILAPIGPSRTASVAVPSDAAKARRARLEALEAPRDRAPSALDAALANSSTSRASARRASRERHARGRTDAARAEALVTARSNGTAASTAMTSRVDASALATRRDAPHADVVDARSVDADDAADADDTAGVHAAESDVHTADGDVHTAAPRAVQTQPTRRSPARAASGTDGFARVLTGAGFGGPR